MQANPEQLYAQHLQNKLLTTHTYSHVSGGHPACIPDLTWQQLKSFHATHYHPSNARYVCFNLKKVANNNKYCRRLA